MKVMTPYYEKQFERGLVFQDFVYELLNQNGISTVAYSSRMFQLNKGENKAKMEIKFDDKLADTGNLWIEVAEKSNPKNLAYVDSGILRDCNEYVIGNYDIVYRLPVSILRLMMEKRKYEIRENRLKTSRGFLLPAREAARIAIQTIPCNCAVEMNALIESQNGSRELVESHIRDMLRAIKCDPNQITMFEEEDDDR
jgi:hypothetical protein